MTSGGEKGDVELLLQEAAALAEKTLSQQREFLAGVAGLLTRKVEINKVQIQTVFQQTWKAQSVEQDGTTPAQQFLKNPSEFKFQEIKSDGSKNPPGFR